MLRNKPYKLIHDYEGVDIDRVWLTLELSIPELLKKIKPLLQLS